MNVFRMPVIEDRRRQGTIEQAFSFGHAKLIVRFTDAGVAIYFSFVILRTKGLLRRSSNMALAKANNISNAA